MGEFIIETEGQRMIDTDARHELQQLKKQLSDAQQEINSLKISVRAEELKVRISSEYSNFALWEYDIAEDVCYQYKKLSGRYEEHLEPIVHFRDTIISWGTVYTEDIPEFNKFCDALERGDKEIRYDMRCINDASEIVWFRYEGKTICDDDGRPVRVVGRTLDVTEEKGGIENGSDSRHDLLTGALTASAFAETVSLRTTGQYYFRSSAIISFAIDGLGKIDEQYGEEYGQYIRKTVGGILIGIANSEHDSAVGRMGDGEFALFICFQNLHALREKAEQICSSVKNYPFLNGVWVTLSAGIAVFKNAKKYESVIVESHAALKAALNKGAGHIVHYSSSIDTGSVHVVSRRAMFGDSGTMPAGMAAVYDLVTHAFIDKERRIPIMTQALCEAGKVLGADYISIAMLDSNGVPSYETYTIPDSTLIDKPCVVSELAGGALRTALKTDSIILDADSNGGSSGGFLLCGNASCALLRSIMGAEQPVGWFCVASEKKLEPTDSDARIIELLSKALNKMNSAREQDERDAKRMKMVESALGNLHIEAFVIEPGTFVVEHVGSNAFAHYGLKSGDVCYKKLHGRNKPCRDCPAVLLDKGGKLTETCAMYNETQHTWLDLTASVEENELGERRYLVCSTDITNCLGKIKNHDILTGVMTFDMFTAEAMRLTSVNCQEYHAAVINVAGFRRINEDSGYEFGNSVLISVADILERSIGAGELIGRSEGSRFVALFKNRSYSELEVRLTQLLASIQKQVYGKFGKQIYLIAGVYEMGEDGVGIMTALDRAITAQKTVKDKTYYQENLIARYDTSLKEELKNRRFIESHMLEALDNDEFKVFYQPKVSIKTRKIMGAEALVRWIRPGGETISPGKFVPIFESNGFIADMDFAIYRHVIADIKRWMRKGYDIPLISLNVSRHHLKDETFPQKLSNLVDALDVPHELIELEITESLLTENMSKLVETMTVLKSTGFRISIDDFGSGYSSLNLITQLPFDTLKIDGGFFLKNELSERNRKVISSVVTLAKSLNLETVSEGVERQEQVDFLRGLGCDLIQGYFFFRPMPGTDFEGLIGGEATAKDKTTNK